MALLFTLPTFKNLQFCLHFPVRNYPHTKHSSLIVCDSVQHTLPVDFQGASAYANSAAQSIADYLKDHLTMHSIKVLAVWLASSKIQQPGAEWDIMCKVRRVFGSWAHAQGMLLNMLCIS